MRDATSQLRSATRRAKSDVANKLVSMFLHDFKLVIYKIRYRKLSDEPSVPPTVMIECDGRKAHGLLERSDSGIPAANSKRRGTPQPRKPSHVHLMKATLSRRSLLLAAVARASAQEVKFSTSVDVVTLLATVRNRDGGIVNDLNQDDFALEEDGRPQTIRYFSRESNLPLTLGLLVDTSRSQIEVLQSERKASYAFLGRMLREDDQAFIAKFDIDVEVLQELTASRELLSAGLDRLQIPKRQSTLLFDAIHQTSDDPMRKKKGRKAFILLSDGVDYGSKTTLPAATEYAQRADTLIYSIWFHRKWHYRGPLEIGYQAIYFAKGKKAMERLSRETGGRFFEVTKSHPIESIYREIEEELRNQYSFGYTSDHQGNDKEYRKITLSAKRPGLIVQTRAGYYPS
jgi:VWFA-related protein